MNKTAILIILLFLGIGIFLYRISIEKNNISLSDDRAYLFVGEGCPHCEKVEAFISENKIGDKITIETKEVFKNIGNQKYYRKAFQLCGQDVKDISVPVLYYRGECLSGDVDIEKKLEELAK